MFFKALLKVCMAHYTLWELLTDMSHYENLTSGKIKDSERYSHSWVFTALRDTENIDHLISALQTVYYTYRPHSFLTNFSQATLILKSYVSWFIVSEFR